MEAQSLLRRNLRFVAVWALIFLGLVVSGLTNYLLFHAIAEVFSVSVAATVFMVSWNTRRSSENGYFSFLGIAFLFVAALDLLHLLSYKGMGVFPGYGTNLPTQLWIAMRYLVALSFLVAPAFVRRPLNHRLALAAYAAVTALLIASIFHWNNFPACFIDGKGLTPFKIASEYVISGLFLASTAFLLTRRERFEPEVLRLLVAAAIVSIGTEMAFTLYTDVYGVFNLLGHFLEILSFYLVYEAVVGTDLVRRHELNLRLTREIEDRTRAEERSRHLASFPQLNPHPVLELDASGAVVYSNAAAQTVLKSAGMDPGAVSAFLPADMDRILEALEKGDESILRREVSIGDRAFAETVHLAPRFRVVRIYAIDITESKRAQGQILRAKEEWERTFDAVPDLIAILDDRHRILRVNKAMAQRLGMTPAACIGLSCHETVHGLSAPPEFCPHARTLLDGREHIEELREERLGGDFLVSTTPLLGDDGERIGSVHVARDVTESRRAAEELLAAKEGLEVRVAERTAELLELNRSLGEVSDTLNGIIRASPLAVILLDPDGKVKLWNPAAERLFDWAQAEVLNRFLPIVPEEKKAEFLSLLRRGRNGESLSNIEVKRQRKDGSGVDVLASTAPLRDGDGAFVGNLVMLADISGRKRAETALRESEARFRAVVEHSPVGICIVQDDRIAFQNPELMRLFGPMPDGFELRMFRDVHPEDAARFDELCEAVSMGEGRGFEGELRFYPYGKAPEGTDLRWVRASASPLEYRGRRAALMTFVDITRLKEMEHQFLVREKMATLGHVAAGIAHEIRNPLSGINIHLSALEKFLESAGESPGDPEDTSARIIDQIRSASARIESVIKKVMDFARPGAARMELTDLQLAIEEAIDFSTTVLRKGGITVDRSLLGDLPRCVADHRLITQVLMNLITNAVQAMEGQHSAKRIGFASRVEGDRLILSVSDAGPGVAPAMRARIFDPFFTTRKDGYGVGLSLCHRIVADHGGTIAVETSRWGGAEFRIELPIRTEYAAGSR